MAKTEAGKEKRIRSFDPMELAISGGKCLPDDEQGPLDTDVDIDDELYDPRLTKDLDGPFVANVDAFGVHTGIRYKMRDGVPFVVFGRRRVRAARRVNRERTKTGQPTMRVDGGIEASNDERRIMGVMYSENAARFNDGFTDTVANLRRYMERGVSLDDAAMTFNLPPAKAKSWIDFDDNAIDAVRDLVHRDVMSVSAGVEIVHAGGPDDQRAALLALLQDAGLATSAMTMGAAVEGFATKVVATQAAVDAAIAEANTKLAAQKPNKRTGKTPAQAKLSARAARGAAKSVARPNANSGVTDRRTMNRLLQVMRDKSHGKASEKTIAFWEGAENMLTLIVGGDEGKETDARLVELLKEVRKAMSKGGGK